MRWLQARARRHGRLLQAGKGPQLLSYSGSGEESLLGGKSAGWGVVAGASRVSPLLISPAPSKPTPEASPALTPPSPFRDSVASGSSVPSSPVSESVLCTPPNVTYASVILRDYKQSSSTL